MASGWNFIGIGIFYFGLDRGSGFENLEKYRGKNPKNPDNGVFYTVYGRKIPVFFYLMLNSTLFTSCIFMKIKTLVTKNVLKI